VSHAEAILARHDEALSDLGDAGLSGTVTLGCPEDYSIAYLPGMLQRFCANNSKVELRLICAPTTELRPLLHRRQVDVALVSVSEANEPGVIRSETFAWVANTPSPSILDLPALPLAF
jgi:DNA-binding transcriptional LysR family regulator